MRPEFAGLDARAAAIVMRTVRNTVNTGRTVVCTIHQPSIDIFEVSASIGHVEGIRLPLHHTSSCLLCRREVAVRFAYMTLECCITSLLLVTFDKMLSDMQHGI